MSHSGAPPHRNRGRKDSPTGQGSGCGYGTRAHGGATSSSSSSLGKPGASKLGTKSGKAANGSSSSGEGVRISRTPQSYMSAVAGYNANVAHQRDGTVADAPSDRTHYIAMNLIVRTVYFIFILFLFLSLQKRWPFK